jgi:hypothetical protein
MVGLPMLIDAAVDAAAAGPVPLLAALIDLPAKAPAAPPAASIPRTIHFLRDPRRARAVGVETDLDLPSWIMTVGKEVGFDDAGFDLAGADSTGTPAVMGTGDGAGGFSSGVGRISMSLAGFGLAATSGRVAAVLFASPMKTFTNVPARARSLAAVIRMSTAPGTRLSWKLRTVARPPASVTARSVGKPFANRPPGPSSGK